MFYTIMCDSCEDECYGDKAAIISFMESHLCIEDTEEDED